MGFTSEGTTGGPTDESITATSSLMNTVMSAPLTNNTHAEFWHHKMTLWLTFIFHSQGRLFQSTGSPICLMWSYPKKVFLLKKVPSRSLDHPWCLQYKLLLARSHLFCHSNHQVCTPVFSEKLCLKCFMIHQQPFKTGKLTGKQVILCVSINYY